MPPELFERWPARRRGSVTGGSELCGWRKTVFAWPGHRRFRCANAGSGERRSRFRFDANQFSGLAPIGLEALVRSAEGPRIGGMAQGNRGGGTLPAGQESQSPWARLAIRESKEVPRLHCLGCPSISSPEIVLPRKAPSRNMRSPPRLVESTSAIESESHSLPDQRRTLMHTRTSSCRTRRRRARTPKLRMIAHLFARWLPPGRVHSV